MKVIMFVVYVFFSVAGLVVMKRYVTQLSPASGNWSSVPTSTFVWITFGSLLYLASFAVWLLILRNFPLVTAYPLAVGLTLCGTSIVSWFLLHERLTAGKVAGIFLIIVGAVFIFRSS